MNPFEVFCFAFFSMSAKAIWYVITNIRHSGKEKTVVIVKMSEVARVSEGEMEKGGKVEYRGYLGQCSYS